MSPNDDKTDDDDRLITIKRKQKYFPHVSCVSQQFSFVFSSKTKNYKQQTLTVMPLF
jgi:hypothetical protein